MGLKIEQFGLVQAKNETSYGVAESLDEAAWTDPLYLEEVDDDEEFEAVDRNGMSIFRPGWPSATGTKTPILKAKGEISPVSLNDDIGASSHPDPHCHRLLSAVGFEVTANAFNSVTPATVNPTKTYGLNVFNTPGVTVKLYKRDTTSNLSYQTVTYAGWRADGVISVDTGGKLTLDCDGKAKSVARADVTLGSAPTPDYRDDGVKNDGAGANTANKGFHTPFIGLNAATTLTSGGDTYSGGGLVDFSINLNNNLQVPRSMNSASSVDKVILAPEAAPTIEMTLVADQALSGWNPYTQCENKAKVDWFTDFADPEGGINRFRITAPIYLNTVEKVYVDRRECYKLTGIIGYPDAAQPTQPLKIQFYSDQRANGTPE